MVAVRKDAIAISKPTVSQTAILTLPAATKIKIHALYARPVPKVLWVRRDLSVLKVLSVIQVRKAPREQPALQVLSDRKGLKVHRDRRGPQVRLVLRVLPVLRVLQVRRDLKVRLVLRVPQVLQVLQARRVLKVR